MGVWGGGGVGGGVGVSASAADQQFHILGCSPASLSWGGRSFYPLVKKRMRAPPTGEQGLHPEKRVGEEVDVTLSISNSPKFGRLILGQWMPHLFILN